MSQLKLVVYTNKIEDIKNAAQGYETQNCVEYFLPGTAVQSNTMFQSQNICDDIRGRKK